MNTLLRAVAALLLLFGSAAFALDASPWSEASHSAIRLIEGTPREIDGRRVLVAGLSIRMKPGYKTYWREPGEAGVPPVFDWAGSENLDTVTVTWPAPTRFEDGGSFSIGYKRDVVLPLLVTPKDPSRPVVLKLALDYAVCEKMCIPAQGKATLALDGRTTAALATEIDRFLAQVPREIHVGEAHGAYAVKNVTLVRGDAPALVVTATIAGPAHGLDAFAEGPPGSFFGRPRFELAADASGTATIHIPLEERPRKGGMTRLCVTLVSSAGAIEIEADLDIPGRSP